MARVYDNATDLITFARGSSATYTGSDGTQQTAASDEPRIEYAADGTLKGLLIEEQRTNLVTHSNDLNDASNNRLGSSLNVGASGWLSEIQEDTSNAVHGVRSIQSNVSADWTASCFIKATGSGTRKLLIRIYNNGQGVCYALFDPSDGSVTDSGGAALEGTHSQDMGDGVYRVGMTCSRPLDEPADGVEFVLSSSDVGEGGRTYTGDGSSSIYVGGLQIEEGSFPTSYIPTSGSQQTRSADVASIPVTAFGYNQDAGTVVVEFDTDVPLGSRVLNGVFSIRDNSSDTDDLWRVYLQSNDTLAFQLKSGGSSIIAPGLGAQPTNELTRLAVSVESGSQNVSVDGGATTSLGTTTTIPEAGQITEMAIGEINGNAFLNGHIKSLSYFPRRLTDAQLQSLTE